MRTLLLDAGKIGDIDRTVAILKNSGTVVVPTETVYGLVADMYNERAIRSVFSAKGRSFDNPLTVHISHLDQLEDLATGLDRRVTLLSEVFWPGPLTIVVRRSKKVPDLITAKTEHVGVRFPSGSVIRKVIDKLGSPVVAPSANISGGISPTSFKHVFDDMNQKVDAILKGDDSEFLGIESTVISLVEDTPKILRLGAISLRDIRKVLDNVDIKLSNKVTHYRLKRKFDILAIDDVHCSFSNYINEKKETNIAAFCFTEDEPEIKDVICVTYGSVYNTSEQAKNLYNSMRKLECLPDYVNKIYAHLPKKAEVESPVFSKILEFANFNVVNT